MPKTISEKDLIAMRMKGVEIAREVRPVTVEGLSEMMREMREEMTTLAKERAEMDARIMKQMTEVVSRLTVAIKENKVDQIDLRPVLAELVKMQKKRAEDPKVQVEQKPAEYVFDIQRNSRGFMTSVKARVMEETKH